MFSRRLLGIGFIVGVGLIVAITFGAMVSADNSWGKNHWDGPSLPVQLTLVENFSDKWNTAYANAFIDWDEGNSIVLDLVDGGTSSSSGCNPANGTIEVCAADYGPNNWLGLAQIWTRGPHIRRALAKMNDYYFKMAYYDTPAWRALVMCQEIGHDFGLDHQDTNFYNINLGSCMDYTGAPAGGSFYGSIRVSQRYLGAFRSFSWVT